MWTLLLERLHRIPSQLNGCFSGLIDRVPMRHIRSALRCKRLHHSNAVHRRAHMQFAQSTAKTVVLAAFLFAVSTTADADRLSTTSAWNRLSTADRQLLDDVEHRTFNYFRDSSSTKNGLAADHWPKDSGDYFASIAATGFALTSYGIGVERGWMKRKEAVQRTLATLKFLTSAKQGNEPNASGFHPWFFLPLPGHGQRPTLR